MVRILSCSLLCMILTWPARSDDPKQQSEPTKAGPVLTGTVLLADGTPAAGAEVWVINYTMILEKRVASRTDAQGKVRLELPPLAPYARHAWVIRACLGSQGGEHSFNGAVWHGSQPNQFVLRMAAATTVLGRVLQEEDGKPVAGAKIFAVWGQVLETGTDGSFRLASLPRRNHRLVVTAPGRAYRAVLFSTAATDQIQLEVRMPRGKAMTVRVTDENLQPLPNVWLTFGCNIDPPANDGLRFKSAADGTFRFDGIDPGARIEHLMAYVDGYDGSSNMMLDLRQVTASRPVHIVLFRSKPRPPERQLPTREVAGVIRNEAGQPMAGVVVRTQVNMDSPSYERHTNAEGRFAFPDLPDDPNRPYYLLAQAPGCAPQIVTLPPGVRQVNVVMHPGKTAHGMVLKPNGDPLAGATVLPYVGQHPNWALWEQAAVTDAEGRYELRQLPERFSLHCTHPEYKNRWLNGLPVTETLPELTMESYGGFFGRVLDAEGQPVRCFNVRVLKSLVRPQIGAVAGLPEFFSLEGSTFTSEDGTFRLYSFQAGGFVRVVVSAPGYGQAIVDPVPVLPLDALPVHPLVFRLRKPYQLQVRVTDAASGKPLPASHVTLLDLESVFTDGGPFRWPLGLFQRSEAQSTQADGTVKFDKLPFAAANILVECPGYGRQRLSWKDGAKELQVELKPEAALEVKVIDVRRGQVELELAGQHAFYGKTNAVNGHQVRFEQLPAGNYVLTVYDADNENGMPRKEEFVLRAGDRLQKTVDFTKPKK